MEDYNKVKKEFLLRYIKIMESYIKKAKRSIIIQTAAIALLFLTSMIVNADILLTSITCALWTTIVFMDVNILKRKEKEIQNIINMNSWLFEEQEEEYEIVKVYEDVTSEEKDKVVTVNENKQQKNVIEPINHNYNESNPKILNKTKNK